MKKVLLKNISLVLVTLSLFSCEKNESFLELGSPIGVEAEVYMENLNPVYETSQVVDVPITYWLESRKFTELAMYNSYDSIAVVKIDNVGSVDYSYDNEFTGETLEQELFKTDSHDPAYWTPTEYAYTFNSKYTVDSSLGKEKYKNTNTGADDFSALLSPEFYSEFYNDLAFGMSKDQLYTLLVVDYDIISEDDLNSYYDESNKLTTGGATSLQANLAQVPKADMMGDKFSLEKKNKVILQYWITNNKSLIGKSAYRSFTVK